MAQPPADKLRLGNLTATIWRNLDQHSKPFYTCTLLRSYTDQDGNWHETETFGRSDLLKVAKLADQADSRIEALIQEERQKARETERDTTAVRGAGERQSHQR